jgi:hypothetical protein
MYFYTRRLEQFSSIYLQPRTFKLVTERGEILKTTNFELFFYAFIYLFILYLRMLSVAQMS